ncbi:VOC family protein [Paenibacillus guangzhouensis]|uniref:VOC family protein n=1 Tax=Paenibacillus guangzhouensis TaxID=1473112 RepID=UPI002239357E|nr:VOC family protein [Paenibacillus guangzhouensis]
MFQGQAEEAINLYTSTFDQSELIHIVRYGPEGPGAEGSVMKASFSLHGQVFMAIDSNIQHNFTFTPSISMYVTCDTEEEIDRVYEVLSEGGSVMMPMQAYPFSKKFTWFADRFGVSWQLSLA